MAEPRRVQLTTLCSNVPLPSSLLKIPPKEDISAVCSPLEQETSPATARLVLALFEPDQRRCPEFYYPELVKKKNNAFKGTAVTLEEEESASQRQEAEALAKKFEEKYGPKKRKKDRVQDLIDMGYGYDETDPFIDNSEAYDELVPASLTTKYGGFYINSGTLQFRQASESEPEDDFTQEKKRLKSPKKKLKDGSDKIKKKKKEEGQHKKPKNAGIMPLNANGEKKKKKKQAGALSVDDMLKESLEKEEPKQSHGHQAAAPSIRESDCTLNASDPLLSLIGSANESDLFQAASSIDLGDIDLDKLLYDSPVTSPLGLDENSDPLSGGQAQKQPPTLPEGLPTALEKRISELTQAAKASEGEGKQKFFTQDVNSMLLDIELQSRELNSQARSGVYAHLASFLPCSKDTLVKRAKKLHLHEQDGRLKEPLQRLKEAIGRSMPGQITKYQDECQAHTQAKFAKMLEEGKEQKEKACSDEDEDEEKSGKRVMGPRKKFQWNEEIRNLLCNVVHIKIGSYELERNKSQTAEEYLKAFLEAEVKPLWPKGWMQSRMLFKESKRVHSHVTSIPTKKKVIAAPKIKMKEPFVKLERKIITSLSATPTRSGNSSVLVPCSVSSPSTPVNSFIPSCAGTHSSNSTATPQSYNMDDSLDEDLIHNPPSLEAVSEELAALNNATRGSPDFSFHTVIKPATDNITVLISSEEMKTLPKPSVSSSQSPLNLLAEQALALGQLSQDKKTENSQTLPLPGYKGLLSQTSPNNKTLPENMHAKQKNFGATRPHQSPAPSSLLSRTMKPFHQSHQLPKNFPSPVQFNPNKLQSPSQAKASRYFQQGAGLLQSKGATKSPAFHPLPSALPSGGQGSSAGMSKILPPPGAAVAYVPKHNPTSSATGHPFKPSFPLPAAAKSSVPPGGSAQSGLTPLGAGAMASPHKSPSPGQAAVPQSPNSAAKKALSSQKLTLVAPPGGSNGDSTMGMQGVARLLTSSLKPAAATPAAAAAPAASPTKSTTGTSVQSSSPSINLLSPSFATSGQKLAPGTLGILPGIVPMHTFSFPVITFGSDSKSSGSKDAIVTGPAPGTFHHGLTHSIFAGLHSSPLHPQQLPQCTLSSHLQPSLQDGSQIHGENANVQRKLP
ncbi:ubinuclein-1 isoform X1 [Lepisosteus oculatus]|uniref:ubinuclein-1 isoform X1 n=1 Tax=Lepisosteus oculatus TaxID=7918 RepID=UPI0035F514CF